MTNKLLPDDKQSADCVMDGLEWKHNVLMVADRVCHSAIRELAELSMKALKLDVNDWRKRDEMIVAMSPFFDKVLRFASAPQAPALLPENVIREKLDAIKKLEERTGKDVEELLIMSAFEIIQASKDNLHPEKPIEEYSKEEIRFAKWIKEIVDGLKKIEKGESLHNKSDEIQKPREGLREAVNRIDSAIGSLQEHWQRNKPEHTQEWLDEIESAVISAKRELERNADE